MRKVIFLLFCILIFVGIALYFYLRPNTIYVSQGTLEGYPGIKKNHKVVPFYGFNLPEYFKKYNLVVKTQKSYRRLKKIAIFCSY